jgi:hypothetical protein
MNRRRAADLLGSLPMRRQVVTSPRNSTNRLDNTAFLSGAPRVYRALTSIGKDYRYIGRKSIARIRRDHSRRPSEFAVVIARVTNGNGEQPWL